MPYLDHTLQLRLLLLAASLIIAACAALPLLRAVLPALPFQLIRPVHRIARRTETRLNRLHRHPADLHIRGTIWLIILLTTSAVCGALISVATITFPHGWAAECAAISLCLIAGNHTAYRALHHQLPEYALSATSDDYSRHRFTIEHLVHALANIISASLLYSLLGLPALLAWCSLLSLLHHTPPLAAHHRAFTAVAAHLYGWLTMPSALLSQLLSAVSWRLTRAGQPVPSIPSFTRHDYHGSLTSLVVQCARHTGTSLGGRYQLNDTPLTTDWVGAGSAQATRVHVIHTLHWYAVTYVIWTSLICVAIVLV